MSVLRLALLDCALRGDGENTNHQAHSRADDPRGHAEFKDGEPRGCRVHVEPDHEPCDRPDRASRDRSHPRESHRRWA